MKNWGIYGLNLKVHNSIDDGTKKMKKQIKLHIRSNTIVNNNKKEQERAELHRTIWNIANDLRGSVDGWDFKQYVLGILFYRYISENITAYINTGEHEAGNDSFEYVLLSDSEAEQAREDLVQSKGFFI